MSRKIIFTKKFNRDYKRMLKRGKNMQKLESIVITLAHDEILEPRYADHALAGNYAGYRECHIEPDWLLVYQKHDQLVLTLLLSRTGTHSDLFDE